MIWPRRYYLKIVIISTQQGQCFHKWNGQNGRAKTVEAVFMKDKDLPRQIIMFAFDVKAIKTASKNYHRCVPLFTPLSALAKQKWKPKKGTSTAHVPCWAKTNMFGRYQKDKKEKRVMWQFAILNAVRTKLASKGIKPSSTTTLVFMGRNAQRERKWTTKSQACIAKYNTNCASLRPD